MVGMLYHKKIRNRDVQKVLQRQVLKPKSPLQLERIIKGFANQHRLRILLLLSKNSDVSIENISKQLSIGYMNTSDHVRKLAMGGLVTKKKIGLNVFITLSTRGKSILVFCKKLE